MPTIALLAQKGGAGKTTLAIHLAVAAGSATIIDTDKQQSAAGWYKTAERDAPFLMTSQPGNVPKAIGLARDSQWKIIDTPPYASDDLRPVVDAADLILIPTRPSILDLRAIAPTVAMAKGKKAAIVLNSCPSSRLWGEAGITIEARKALKAYGLPVAPVSITQRVALSHALTSGQAVTEYEPKGKAAEEIRKLWEWVRGQAAA